MGFVITDAGYYGNESSHGTVHSYVNCLDIINISYIFHPIIIAVVRDCD